MKILSALALVLFLGACGLTPQGTTVRWAVQTKGSEVADAALDNSVWYTCKGATVGSIIREFGKSDDLWDAWKTICLTSTDLEKPGKGEGE